jgi:hypothetical protein
MEKVQEAITLLTDYERMHTGEYYILWCLNSPQHIVVFDE